MTRILRGGPYSTRIYSKAGWSAVEQALRLRRRAREGAAQRLREARQQADEMREALSAQVRNDTHRTLAAQLAQATTARREILDRSRQEITELAIAAAAKLFERQLELQPSRIASIVERTVQKAHRATQVRVRAHPQDVEEIQRWLEDRPDGRSWQVVEDGELTRGGCIVTTDVGRVDARFEVRLEALRQALSREL